MIAALPTAFAPGVEWHADKGKNVASNKSTPRLLCRNLTAVRNGTGPNAILCVPNSIYFSLLDCPIPLMHLPRKNLSGVWGGLEFQIDNYVAIFLINAIPSNATASVVEARSRQIAAAAAISGKLESKLSMVSQPS